LAENAGRINVKEWLRENIARFNLEQPEMVFIEMVPDEFLTQEAIEAEGGARRRRSVNSLLTTASEPCRRMRMLYL